MTDRTERDRFVYDPSVRRYRDIETGGFVSARDVNLGRHTPGRQPREERQGEPRLDELFTRRSSAAPEDQQREVGALREALAARDRELERERAARQEADTRARLATAATRAGVHGATHSHAGDKSCS